MAGGGGKGGSTSTEVSIPAWLEDAAKSGLARGQQAAGIGYVPYRGPDVAALTPLQEAAMFNTGQAASAFGLAPSPIPSAGMPTVQTFADGTRGYSSAPLYDQAVNELKMRDPVQYAKLMTPFDGGGQFGITSMPMGGPMGGAAQSYGQPMREGPPQGSGASRDYGSTAADRIAQGGGNTAASRIAASNLASRLPGGVNTRDPSSALNQAAARLTSKPQGAPTQKDRPAPRPTSGSSSGSSRGSSGRTSAPEPSTKYSANDRRGNSRSGGSSSKGRK